MFIAGSCSYLLAPLLVPSVTFSPVVTDFANNILLEQLCTVSLVELRIDVLTLRAPLKIAAYSHLAGHLSPLRRQSDLFAILMHNHRDIHC